MIPLTETSQLLVGKRISCDGNRGTIRFVGEIEGTTDGTWFGIEWDDPRRGKHDGSYNGIRYFAVKETNAGSFVRPSKVTLGRSCSEAILEQYEPLALDKLHTMQEEAVFKANNKQVKSFEYVGFDDVWDKMSKHENLITIGLQSQRISHGDSTLTKLCPNLIEIDLKQNLISSWEDLASIISYLPNLKIVNITDNRIEQKTFDEKLISSFNRIETLIAANMNINSLLEITTYFPNLIKLYVPKNKIETLNFEMCTMTPNLRELNLESNPIKNWEEVLNICNLRNLEYLNLKDTKIKEIYFEEQKYFPNLKRLNISNNLIDSWASISNLEKLPKLEELTIQHNPVLNCDNYETNRQIIICRIDSLKILNKMVVTDIEKRGAGLDYLRKYGKEYFTARDEQTLDQFNFIHPCYKRLIDKYDAPESSEVIPLSNKLKLLTLKIICPENVLIEKKVPNTMKIQRLRGLIEKHLNTDASKALILKYKSQDQPNITYHFDNDLKDLHFYSIQSGDEIHVEY